MNSSAGVTRSGNFPPPFQVRGRTSRRSATKRRLTTAIIVEQAAISARRAPADAIRRGRVGPGAGWRKAPKTGRGRSYAALIGCASTKKGVGR